MTRQDILGVLKSCTQQFDLVVIGGGITGAGVAREAAGSGLSTLLVEQKDFAWGTSSRSSKMVHGGLRYLGSGQVGLTRDAVRERQRIMEEAPGLVEPLPFLMPHYKGQFPGPRLFQLLLSFYDRLAGTHSRQRLTPAQTLQWAPGLAQHNLIAASSFTDALTDDARLVQRLLAEARLDGAVCINYVTACGITRDSDGRVSGVDLVAEGDNRENAIHIKTTRVINATGAWADQLQKQGPTTDPLTIRPLRGSHLVLPWRRLPVTCAVSLMHPRDKRPVFAFPWAGTTILGTTDLDHQAHLNLEPCITQPEVAYLLDVSGHLFPEARIQASDIVSTWAGVRPVVTDGHGKAPSKENREHALRNDKGMISIAGGKLTTFRQIAREALLAVLNGDSAPLRSERSRVFTEPAATPRPELVSHLNWRRLKGFYGPELPAVLQNEHFDQVGNTSTLWAELTWACRSEQVVHLDDLLLRRTRLGLIYPNGAKDLLPAIREHCQPVLGWGDHQWQQEVDRYLQLYQQAYSLPETGEA